jgi:hypothetical protein
LNYIEYHHEDGNMGKERERETERTSIFYMAMMMMIIQALAYKASLVFLLVSYVMWICNVN